jgi:hypothetical protein
VRELADELDRAEEQVTRLVIAREEVTRILEDPVPAEPPARRPGGAAGFTPPPGPPVGAVTVPPRQESADALVLPQSYQDLLEVAADAGRPLRAGEFAAAAGLPGDKAKVESLRSKLKLLAARGWLEPRPGGLFTLPADAGNTGNLDSEGPSS